MGFSSVFLGNPTYFTLLFDSFDLFDKVCSSLHFLVLFFFRSNSNFVSLKLLDSKLISNFYKVWNQTLKLSLNQAGFNLCKYLLLKNSCRVPKIHPLGCGVGSRLWGTLQIRFQIIRQVCNTATPPLNKQTNYLRT